MREKMQASLYLLGLFLLIVGAYYFLQFENIGENLIWFLGVYFVFSRFFVYPTLSKGMGYLLGRQEYGYKIIGFIPILQDVYLVRNFYVFVVYVLFSVLAITFFGISMFAPLEWFPLDDESLVSLFRAMQYAAVTTFIVSRLILGVSSVGWYSRMTREEEFEANGLATGAFRIFIYIGFFIPMVRVLPIFMLMNLTSKFEMHKYKISKR